MAAPPAWVAALPSDDDEEDCYIVEKAQGAQAQGQQVNWINPSVHMCRRYGRYGPVIRSLSPNDTELLKGYFCDEVCPIPPPIACIQSQPPPAGPEPISQSALPSALTSLAPAPAPAPTSQPTVWPQLSDSEWPALPSAPTSRPLSYKDALLSEIHSHIRELTLEELLELDLTSSEAEGIYDRSLIRELSLNELLALDAESNEEDGDLKLIHCGKLNQKTYELSKLSTSSTCDRAALVGDPCSLLTARHRGYSASSSGGPPD